MKRPAPIDPRRRSALGRAAGTAVALAAAAALPRAVATPAAAPSVPEPAGPRRGGYRETERIRTYYALARY